MMLIRLILLIIFNINNLYLNASADKVKYPLIPSTVSFNFMAHGKIIKISLLGSALGLLGFSEAPSNSSQQANLNLALENLQAGAGLIRFNPEAGCQLSKVHVTAELAQNKNNHLKSSDQIIDAPIRAQYEFICDWPARLTSAALGIFIGFPMVTRALVQYTTAAGCGGAELTPVHPVVSFIPFLKQNCS